MTMKISDRRVIRIHLRVNHGIHVKRYRRRKEVMFIGGSRIFGVSLGNLQRRYIPEYGLVPCFVVDACSFLLERAGAVGLFRKAGSLLRIKTLRAKLNRGEGWLSTALPYDVASLLKQFCRELPEPLFPTELHAALLKAQAQPTLKERTSAIQLLSCLLPARNSSLLHFLLIFLSNVSQRCAENLMTSSNLAVVFAPCLLPPSNKEEMADRCFQLRVDVLRTFIENAHSFGVVPKAVKDSIPFLLGNYLSKDNTHFKGRSREKRTREAVTRTPVRSSSVSDLGQGYASTNGQPLRRCLGLEAFPNILLFRSYTSSTDQNWRRPTTALLDTSPIGKLICRTSSVKPKRAELGGAGWFSKLTRGQDPGWSPVQTKVGKLNLTPWRRRSAP